MKTIRLQSKSTHEQSTLDTDGTEEARRENRGSSAFRVALVTNYTKSTRNAEEPNNQIHAKRRGGSLSPPWA